MNGFDEPKAKKPRISNYSTNWCDLPMEMRVECIKRMNFKTKTCLGATSHTEKALVDAMKHHFDYAELVLGLGSSSSFECRTKNDIFFKLSMSIELTSVVKILKDCEIDTFVFKGHSIGSERPQFWSNIKKCAPFRFKKFVWQGDYDDSLLTFLKNIEDNEEIELRYYQRVKLTDLMAIQAVRNTKRLTTSIYGCDINEFHTIVQIMQRWIDEDAAIGKSMLLCGWLQELFSDLFFDKLASRVISKKGKELIRIRTDNESKHILIKNYLGIFRCTIIPSHLLESEYDKLNV